MKHLKSYYDNVIAAHWAEAAKAIAAKILTAQKEKEKAFSELQASLDAINNAGFVKNPKKGGFKKQSKEKPSTEEVELLKKHPELELAHTEAEGALAKLREEQAGVESIKDACKEQERVP
jgi:2-oxo-4-hydroxy-4-carboxy--5-ureidoimidazoline (OHCU) decarboxylase